MRIWERFPELFKAVRQSHEEVGLVGHHDFVHAARVGEIARQIALDEWNQQIADLAGTAGLCHNADRILQKRLGVGRSDIPAAQVSQLIESWLAAEDKFNIEASPWPAASVKDDLYYTSIKCRDVERITATVLGHDGRNSPDDSRILIALMDADRLVSLDGDLFARSGQYYHDLPVVDYRYFPDFDPEATYRNPKTVFRDIAYSLDWIDPISAVCVRTRLGKAMGARRANLFRLVTDGLRDQLAEEGIIPYPFDK